MLTVYKNYSLPKKVRIDLRQRMSVVHIGFSGDGVR